MDQKSVNVDLNQPNWAGTGQLSTDEVMDKSPPELGLHRIIGRLKQSFDLARRSGRVYRLVSDPAYEAIHVCNPINTVMSYGVMRLAMEVNRLIVGDDLCWYGVTELERKGRAKSLMLWDLIEHLSSGNLNFEVLGSKLHSYYRMRALLSLVAVSDFLYCARDDQIMTNYFSDDIESVLSVQFMERAKIETGKCQALNDGMQLMCMVDNIYVDYVNKLFGILYVKNAMQSPPEPQRARSTSESEAKLFPEKRRRRMSEFPKLAVKRTKQQSKHPGLGYKDDIEEEKDYDDPKGVSSPPLKRNKLDYFGEFLQVYESGVYDAKQMKLYRPAYLYARGHRAYLDQVDPP